MVSMAWRHWFGMWTNEQWRQVSWKLFMFLPHLLIQDGRLPVIKNFLEYSISPFPNSPWSRPYSVSFHALQNLKRTVPSWQELSYHDTAEQDLLGHRKNVGWPKPGVKTQWTRSALITLCSEVQPHVYCAELFQWSPFWSHVAQLPLNKQVCFEKK